MKTKTESQAKLDLIVERIVERFDPHSVWLVGYRGYSQPNDFYHVDLLVVLDEEFVAQYRHPSVEVRLCLHGVGMSKDIFVTTPQRFAKRKHQVNTMEEQAHSLGKVLYERRC